MRHGMRVPYQVLLQVISGLLKTNPNGPQNPGVDEEMHWDPPSCIIRPKERDVRPPSNIGYLSEQNPM